MISSTAFNLYSADSKAESKAGCLVAVGLGAVADSEVVPADANLAAVAAQVEFAQEEEVPAQGPYCWGHKDCNPHSISQRHDQQCNQSARC